MMEKNNTITYMKALGIMLMVLGHANCTIPFMCGFLTMFHMPLFFLLSGYCLKEKYLDRPKDFFSKRVRALYVPYMKWVVLFTMLHNVFFYLHLYDNDYGLNGIGTPMMSWKEILNTVSLAVFQMRGAGPLLGGFWFLNALLFGSAIAWVILHYVRKPIYSVAVALLLFTIVHFTGFHVVFLNLNARAFAAAFLVVSGYAIAQLRVPTFNLYAILGSLALTFFGIFHWMEKIDHSRYDGNNIFPYFLTAILATWSFYSLFVHWKETESIMSRAMRFMGENTLTILTWHLLSFKVVSLVIVLLYGLPVNRLAEYPVIEEYATQGWWIAYFVVSMAICCLVAQCRDCLGKSGNSHRR